LTASPQGRRILIAVVTGPTGDEIQRWRETHDPEQARRIPPHTTLCYWAHVVDPAVLETQIRHAFPAPIHVRLGAARTFDNRDRTRYLPVLDTDELDAARVRLYDGNDTELPKDHDWEWHVTCVRYDAARDTEELSEAIASLPVDAAWLIDTVAYMELRDGVYDAIATWAIGAG